MRDLARSKNLEAMKISYMHNSHISDALSAYAHCQCLLSFISQHLTLRIQEEKVKS